MTHDIIDEEQSEIYVFGISSMIQLMIHNAAILLLGIILGHFAETVLFLFVYAAIRETAGGQHFDNKALCFLTSCALVVILAGPISLVPLHTLVWLSYTCLGPAMFVLYLLAPCDNHNKPMNQMERKFFRKKTRVLLIISAIAALALLYVNSIYGYVIVMSLVLEAAGLICGTIQNGIVRNASSTSLASEDSANS